MKIPKGNTTADVVLRRRMIEKKLSSLKVRKFKCPCLGGVIVHLTPKGISELAHYACISEKSTKAALSIRRVLNNARFVKMTLPKDNKSQKEKFQFLFVYILESKMPNGDMVKVTVGVRETPLKFLQYSITGKE